MMCFSYNFLFVPELIGWVNHFLSKPENFNKFYFENKTSNNEKTSSFVPKELRPGVNDIVNPELMRLSLPRLEYFHLFVWPPYSGGYYEGHIQDIHIDIYPFLLEKQKKIAYNIPIVGADNNCYLEWYNDAKKVYSTPESETKTKTGNKLVLEWEQGPEMIEEVPHIKPRFITINKPHRIRSGKNIFVVASLRFERNHSLKEYYEYLILKGKKETHGS